MERQQGTLAPVVPLPPRRRPAAPLLRRRQRGRRRGDTRAGHRHGAARHAPPARPGHRRGRRLLRAPVVLIGGEQYPAAGLRSGALYVVVGAMIGYTVQASWPGPRPRLRGPLRGTRWRTSLHRRADRAGQPPGLGGLDRRRARRGRSRRPAAVRRVFDLDRFKAYNDAHGHPRRRPAGRRGGGCGGASCGRPTSSPATAARTSPPCCRPARSSAHSSSSASGPPPRPGRRCPPGSPSGTAGRTPTRWWRAPTPRCTRPRPRGATAPWPPPPRLRRSMAQFHWDPDGYLEMVRAEVPGLRPPPGRAGARDRRDRRAARARAGDRVGRHVAARARNAIRTPS